MSPLPSTLTYLPSRWTFLHFKVTTSARRRRVSSISEKIAVYLDLQNAGGINAGENALYFFISQYLELLLPHLGRPEVLQLVELSIALFIHPVEERPEGSHPVVDRVVGGIPSQAIPCLEIKYEEPDLVLPNIVQAGGHSFCSYNQSRNSPRTSLYPSTVRCPTCRRTCCGPRTRCTNFVQFQLFPGSFFGSRLLLILLLIHKYLPRLE